MNFFDVSNVVNDENGTRIVLEGAGSIQIPPQYNEQAKAVANKKLIFGIRPEDLEDVALLPSRAESSSTLEAPVDVVEYLGSELLVYLTLAGKTLTARLDQRSNAHVGSKLTLQVNSAHIHLFDTETGKAIF
jgi:multiple sugar transport system ATP-binding protein